MGHCMDFDFPANCHAWAVGTMKRKRFHVRKIVWGRLMARAEKRKGEQILKAIIHVDVGAD